MYKLIQIFCVLGLLTGCFDSKNKEEKLKDNNLVEIKVELTDSTSLRVRQLSNFNLSQLSLGNDKITDKEFRKKNSFYIKKGTDVELNNEFIYSSKGEILKDYFHNFYKPTVLSSVEEDKYPLYDDKDYIQKVGVKSSGLENIIKNKGGVYLCVFFVNFNYDKEYENFIKPIRYLVSFDENLNILNEFTLSFFYETETKSFIKLFYLDENLNIYTNYYRNKEYEDGNIKETFSDLYKYTVLYNGTISEKNSTYLSTKEGLFKKNKNSLLRVDSIVYAQVETYLNMRSTPNSSGDIIAKAYPKDALKVLEVLDGWVKVELNGKQGYVSKDFVNQDIQKIEGKYLNLSKNQNISKNWQGKYHYLDEEGTTAGGDWTGHYTNYRITKDSVHLTTDGHMSGREDYYLAEEKGDTLMLYRYQDIRDNNKLYQNIEQEKLYKKGDTYYFLVNGQEKKGVKVE